jgi:uncharacterized protein YehS (DUF1456 family)
MNNNDILIRLRYALDIKDNDMLEIFKFGGIDMSREALRELLVRQESETPADEKLSVFELESFLNGLIISQRGVKKDKEGKVEPPSFIISNAASVNNVMLKKIKIAMSYTSQDILDFLSLANVQASSSEIGAILRKEGHRNYKACGDRYARNFLKGMALHYRG